MTLDNIPITTITSLYNAVEYVVQREDKPKEILPLKVRQKFFYPHQTCHLLRTQNSFRWNV